MVGPQGVEKAVLPAMRDVKRPDRVRAESLRTPDEV